MPDYEILQPPFFELFVWGGNGIFLDFDVFDCLLAETRR